MTKSIPVVVNNSGSTSMHDNINGLITEWEHDKTNTSMG